MREIPYLIAEKLDRQDMAYEPTLFADIYYQNEGMDSIASPYRMRGDGDVSVGEDVDVAYEAFTGSMMLDHGTAVAPDVSSPAAAYATLLDRVTSVTDIYFDDVDWTMECVATVFGVCVAWGRTRRTKYRHTVYVYIYRTTNPERSFRFTCQSTKRVSSISLMAGNSGDLAGTVYAEIREVQSGMLVGNVCPLVLPAGSAHGLRTISGISAQLFEGREYYLRLWLESAHINSIAHGAQRCVDEIHGCYISIGGLSTAATDWVIPISHPTTNASLGSITLGGYTQYAVSGTVVRNLDVGSVSDAPGLLGLTTNVPLGTNLEVDAVYATNDPAVAAESPTVPAHWNVIPGPYSDGIVVPSFRFWRIVIKLYSNATHDESPQLGDARVTYSGYPVVVGTIAGAVQDIDGNWIVQAVRALDKASTSSQSLDAKLKTTMVGQFSLELAPEPEVKMLATMPLRGKRVVVRAGVNGVDVTMPYYTGVVRDLAFSAGRYILTLQDPVDLADVSIPRVRHAAWSAVTTYGLSDITTSGDKAYRSLQAANLNHAVTDAAWWAEYPSVWIPVAYSAGTHLADIAFDMLANQVNLADRYIDFKSFSTIKTLRPSRTIVAQRAFDQPVKVRDLLDEIALLLEAQWVTRGGMLSLVPDPDSTTLHVDTLTKHDIGEGLEWRRGFSDIRNEVLILSGYTLTGSSESFTRGQALNNADSVELYGMAAMQEIKDRFGLSESELTTIANNFINRWKDGKRYIRHSARLGKLHIEAGDVVRISSDQLPDSEQQDIKCVAIQATIDWMNTSLKLTLLEV